MKKLLILAATAAFGLSVYGQDNLKIKYSVKIEGMPAEYAAYGEQEITTYIKGTKSKTEVSSMMFTSTTLINGEEVISLTEAMGNKTGYRTTLKEMEADNKSQDKPKIEYTSEKKTIAGYECTKALVTSYSKKEKTEIKMTVWFTEKLKFDKSKMNRGGSFDMGDLKGMPLEVEMPINSNGMEMKMLMTTVEVSTDALDDSLFKLDTSGYTLVSYSEFKEKAKMRGGN